MISGEEFRRAVRAALRENRLSIRATCRAINYDHAFLSRVLAGKQPPSVKLAASLDNLLGARGEIVQKASDLLDDGLEQGAGDIHYSTETAAFPAVVHDAEIANTRGPGILPSDGMRLRRNGPSDDSGPEAQCDRSGQNPRSLISVALPERRLKVPSNDGDAMKRRSLLAVGGVAAAETAHVIQALNVTVPDDIEDPGVDVDTLNELVMHYAEAAGTATPASIYHELLNVRAYAGGRLDRLGRSRRRWSDLIVATGYLSGLLAVVTSYMNDHAAALVWCADAERRSREAHHPELAGWAFLTKATIAYYQGQAMQSATLASHGQSVCRSGTVAHAKLAAQEMRARAMLGHLNGMEDAKRRASAAIAKLPGTVPNVGVFSITLDEDPPYTASSLLLVRKYEQAITATRRVIRRAYRPGSYEIGEQPSNYARSLLVLGLAKARIGDLTEASGAGMEALTGARLVWPTLVLANKLYQVMRAKSVTAPDVTRFHDCLMECTKKAALATPPTRKSE